MNELMNMNNEAVSITMSSNEIATLVGSRHSDVMRSIERLIDKGIIKGYAPTAYTHPSNGQTYNEYLLEKRDTYVVVAQLSPEFTGRLVDRWQELEEMAKGNSPMAIASTMNSQQLALLLSETKAKELAQQQLALAAPKAEFVDNYVERETLQNATQAAQTFGMSAKAMNKILDEIGGVYNKNVKRGRVFTQSFIDKGYGEMKQTAIGFPQPLFSPKGIVHISQMLLSEGII